MSRDTDCPEDVKAYFCGWAITGRDTVAHVISAANFPLAGTQHRAWCGETITVIALTLNARRARLSCPDCNELIRMFGRGQYCWP